MKIVLVSINAKYIHTNNAVRLLKANSDFDMEIMEFTIKDNISDIVDKINTFIDWLYLEKSLVKSQQH